MAYETDLLKELTVNFLDRYVIFEDYSEMCSGIFYYQDQQIGIRATAIKVLLGVMAISGSFSYLNVGVFSYTLMLISVLLPMVAVFIVTILLFNDLVYKEGLKMGFLSEAKRYEKENTWITPYHECLITETELHNTRRTTHISLYFGCTSVLIFLSAFSLCIQFQNDLFRLGIICVFFLIYFLYKTIINKYLNHPKEPLDQLGS